MYDLIVSFMSLFAWFRDSDHQYFIFIQHRRKKFNRHHLTRRDLLDFIEPKTKANTGTPKTPHYYRNVDNQQGRGYR